MPMKILGVIPARYASTRYPAKPLVDIGGKSMVQRVFEQVSKAASLSDVVIATDNNEIFNHAKSFGGKVVMTKDSHISGTDRCYEALTLTPGGFDYVINIQGDEPFIQPDQIDLLAGTLDHHTEIATLVKAIEDVSLLFNPNIVKAVLNQNSEALYFSRATIPYLRNVPEHDWLKKHRFFKHIGMYAYRSDVLEKITGLSIGELEKAESLEQLRWLENGYKIKVAETKTETLGIDTPEDLTKALEYLKTLKDH
jgi:3-deoxy-manno-octulosonate cytidylyltransferase (CMP-KDO synthetase)